MPDLSVRLVLAIYAVWVSSIALALYLMLTERAAARPVVTIVLFGSDGIAFVAAIVLIAQAAGAL